MNKENNIPTNLNFDVTKKIKVKELKSFISDVKINSDFVFGVKIINTDLYLFNTGKYRFEQKIETNEKYKDLNLSVKFGQPLYAVFSTLLSDGEVVLNLKTDYPIKIVRKTDNYEIEIYIAPRVDND